MKTEVEQGDCFRYRKTDDGIWVHKILLLVGESHCYVETITKKKEVTREPDNYYSYSREDVQKYENVIAEISLHVQKRDYFSSDFEQISSREYDELRKEVLAALNLQNPENPIFKNIAAAQTAAEAEHLIKFAWELGRDSS